MSGVIWTIKAIDSTNIKDPATKDNAYIVGVCISQMGHILTSSHVVKPDAKYVGSCSTWKVGWTPMIILKRSMAYGLSLLQVEGKSRKKADYTTVAESGILNVNQYLYGFGYPDLSQMPCTTSFLRGSVEYPCEDVTDLPICFNDLDHLFEENKVALKSGMTEKQARAQSPRTVQNVKCLMPMELFNPRTILLMHENIPLVQIKNFHLKHCGGPVFLSSGHVTGILAMMFNEINFAIHVSAIKEFLKDIDLSVECPTLCGSSST